MFGAPLGPDERVVFYRRVQRSVVGAVISGVIFLPFLFLGVLGFIRAARMRKAESHANVITNRRLFTVNGDGQVLEQVSWSEVAGVTLYRRRRGRSTLVVGGRNQRAVMFDEWLAEIQAFIQHVTSNASVLDSMPESPFDVSALPPIKPGQNALVAGLTIAGVGMLVILLALVAVNSSEAPWVGAVGALGLVAGGVLAAVGVSSKPKTA